MTTFTESNKVGDVLKREWDKLHSRETVVIDTGTLLIGQVLGKLTATGKYVAYDNAAATGAETVAGILLEDADASAADANAVILARGPAVVAKSALVLGTADAALAYAGLTALGIVVRTDIGGDPTLIA